MVGEPTWFEIGVADAEKAQAFYGGLFGWEMKPPPSGGGAVIKTPTVGGGLHGGDQGATAMTFFAVDDIDAALERVRELGGKHRAFGGDDAPEQTEWGRFAICEDDQGSTFGLHEPSG